jgi:hypothetical protein
MEGDEYLCPWTVLTLILSLHSIVIVDRLSTTQILFRRIHALDENRKSKSMNCATSERFNLFGAETSYDVV